MAASLRTVAVVLAGGTGSRIGHDLPKQLLKVAGKPILAHTLDAFETSPDVDAIYLLMAKGWLAEAREIVARGGYRKVAAVLAGGDTRNDSTRIALAALGPGECNVLFHDAVRPLVDHRIIADVVAALRRWEAVDVAIGSADTIVVVDEHGVITDVPDRSRLRRGQTPQAFRLSRIRRAYELAAADPDFTSTDDCSVLLRYTPQVPIHVVAGAERNLKVTFPVDVFLADQLFRLGRQPAPRGAAIAPAPIGAGERAAGRFAGTTTVVFGASSGIGAALADLLERAGGTVVRHSRRTSGVHVEDSDAVAAALAEAAERGGGIDHVVVTAGVLRTGALADAADETVAQTVAVNLLGPILVARAAHPYLAKSHGQLLLFTSSSYTLGRAGYALYSATKAAVVNLSQALADEWAADGIRVNCLNPARTATPMRARAFGAEPAGTLLTAQTVARAAADVLVGPDTGQVVDVRLGAAPAAGAEIFGPAADRPAE